MKLLLLVIATAVVLAGCAKNDLRLTNQGTNEWQHIEIKAGGQVIEVNRLKGGATKNLRFKSTAEDGGEVSGTLDGQTHKAELSYFTPNLSAQYNIIFTDDGRITINP